VIAACATEGAISTTAAAAGPSTSAGTGSTTAGAGATTTFGGAGTCVLIPEETEGPYPLDLSGDEESFRSEITEGRPGVPLTLTLSLVDVNAGCGPVEGARIDVWHCDADGVYSGVRQPGNDTTVRLSAVGSSSPIPTARPRSRPSTRAGTRGASPMFISRCSSTPGWSPRFKSPSPRSSSIRCTQSSRTGPRPKHIGEEHR